MSEVEKVKRILSWLEGIPQPPYKIDAELHIRCNLSCKSCSRRASPNYSTLNSVSESIELPLKDWIRMVREAAELGVREWHICGGGEPMYLPTKTLKVMSEIKKFGMTGIITTNGTLWTPQLVEKVVEMGWDAVHFSIDAPDFQTHDYLRGKKGAYRHAVKHVMLLQYIKLKRNVEKPSLNINTVLSNKNYKKFMEMAELVKTLGADYWFVEPLIVYSEAGRKLKLTPKQADEFFEYLPRVRKFCQDNSLETNFTGPDNNLSKELVITNSMSDVVREDSLRKGEEGEREEREEREEKEEKEGKLEGEEGEETIKNKTLKNKSAGNIYEVPCYQPFWHMVLKCDGSVNFCDVFTGGGVSVKNKSLKEIWFGPYFKKMRENMLKGKAPEYCSKCNPSHTTQRRRYRKIMRELGESKNEPKNEPKPKTQILN